MKTSLNERQNPFRDAAGVEARFGLRMGTLLNERSADLPHDISERLRFAREQALERAALARQPLAVTAAPTAVVGRSGGAAVMGRHTPWLFRAATAIPLLALLVGLLVIDELHDRSAIRAAAEVDTALLVDDLPPAAYSDPGFLQFLKTAND